MQKESIRGDEHGGLRGQPHTPPSLGEHPLTVLEAPPRKGLGPLAQMILMPTCHLSCRPAGTQAVCTLCAIVCTVETVTHIAVSPPLI